MNHLIEHIIEPSRLLLRWQAIYSVEQANRTHWIVGELRKDRNEVVCFRYLSESNDFNEARRLGFVGYPSFSDFGKEYCKGVLDNFLRRLPPRSRRDFQSYLMSYSISPRARISDFALLGYTGAKLPSDGFSLVHPLDNAFPPFEYVMEIAGFRHYKGPKMELPMGTILDFEKEPKNRYDPFAVKIYAGGVLIGYVPRGLSESFNVWLDKYDVTASLFRISKEISGSIEKPKAVCFLRVR